MRVSNQKSNFFDDNFQKLSHIGRGGFGEVYHVRHMIEGEEYAVKIVKFLDFVVNYRNSWREDNHLFIQMDYYPQNLQTIIDNKHIVFERQTGEAMKIFEYFISCEIFKELLESVKYLHDLCPPVIHRDLKPSNVLISQNNNNTRFIRLCDLGLATSHDMTSMSHTSNVGTAQYMAPEIFQPRYYSKVDIYIQQTVCNNWANVSINGRQSANKWSIDLPPILFHSIHGENLWLSANSAIARRNDSYCKKITAEWSGSIRFGFTSHDPIINCPSSLPNHVCPDLTKKPGNWAKALDDKFALKNNVLFYYVTETGDVRYGVNGKNEGIFFKGVSTDCLLWALIDVYGKNVGIELVNESHNSPIDIKMDNEWNFTPKPKIQEEQKCIIN
ncbi:unnamed protein product [Medioppia subpectinata]|uniref:Protein kinase domain-containing protein n=1 Tax=Medioppia subpectinata TaxID=1979941 RepID=A0A7R9KX42_9ACAR|nr:unnamed protein product [Medioppia subpectinata]CAG2110352.1 unnamed protein product [Medioppia subpectinata]